MSHSPRVLASLLTLAAAVPSAQAFAPPNLVATTVAGPGQVEVDSQVLATVRIENSGGPLAGDYTAHVVLSDDLVIDLSDPIVATITASVLGSQSVVCTIPESLPDVKHVWGLVVEPAMDEVETSDNWAVGAFVDVLFVDLELEDPAPLEAFVRTTDDLLEPVPVRLKNVGTPESIVVFSTTFLAPAPWLEVDPPNSFAIGGQPGNDVFLRFDHSSLATGTYATTLRFQNVYHAADFVDLEVTLTVGPAFFVPGHRIFGQIGKTGDVDELEFDAIEGMRLILKVHQDSGALSPRISILDEEGKVELVKTFPHSKEDVKKTLKMKSSGRKLMRIESAKGFGQYAIHTQRKLPSLGKAHVVTLKGLGEDEVHLSEVRLLPGAKLDLGADPVGAFSGALTLGLHGPAGEAYDLSQALSDPQGGLGIEGLEFDHTMGSFEVAVGGFGGGAKEKVKLRILPWQPGPATGKIYLD